MERTRFIDHLGARILLLDYSGLRDRDEAIREIEKSKEIIARQPRGSVLTLTNVTDARYDPAVAEALKDLTAHNKPYVKAGAVVGVTGLKRVVFRGVLRFSKRNLEVFDTVDEAKDWLATQA